MKIVITYGKSEGSGESVHPRSLCSHNKGNQSKLQTKSHISGPIEWLYVHD